MTTSLTADCKSNIFLKRSIIKANISSINGITGPSIWNCFRNGAKILTISIKNWNFNLILIFMVLYQNIIRLIAERPSRWWQCLEVFNNSYNKWPNFKSSSCYWYIFHPSGLVKHYWKLIWLVNGNMPISSGWRVIEKPPHAFKIFFNFSPSSFNPRLDDMKSRRAHFKKLGNFLVTLNVLWVFCTD